jgi:hypothetical protein
MSHRSGTAEAVEGLSPAVPEASAGRALVEVSSSSERLGAACLAAKIAAVAVTAIAAGADDDELAAEIAGEEAAHPAP